MAVYAELLAFEKLESHIHRSEIRRDTAYIEDALKTVRTEDWENVEEFFRPRGQQQNNLIHLASYTGRLEMLMRAEALRGDLFIIDKVGRCALHYAAAQGHIDVVEWLMERSTNPLQCQLKDFSGKTPLHLAVLNTRVEVVRILVDAGVNVNIYDQYNMTPLHLAWIGVNRRNPEEMLRYENIVNIILTSPGFEKIDDTSQKGMKSLVLNQAVFLNSITATTQLLDNGLTIPKDAKTLPSLMLPLHIAAARGFHEMLCLLLKRDETSWMIDIREKLGHTPLHVAIIQCQWSCAKTLIEKKGDLLAENNSGQTVLDDLFRYNEHPLTFLTDILDTGVSERTTYTMARTINVVILDFKVLLPRNDQRQMALVSALIARVPSMKEMSILQHPLIEAFLAVKWRRLRIFFFILAAFQTLFVVCLITYGMILLQTKCSLPGPAWILFVCACIKLCYNTLQLLMMPKCYAKQLETWLSMTSAAICVIVVIAEEFLFINSMGSACTVYNCGQPSFWTIQSIGIAMLFACIQMMFLIGRCPSWGSYALMFITVLKTALKVFLAVVSLIVGFTLSFLVLFHSNDEFASPWKAFVKTVVMMTGEYDYSDLLPSTDKKNSSIDSLNSNENENTFQSFISHIVFLAFIMLVSIVVMNLMTGLAVSDTRGLLNEGLVRRLVKQVEFLNHIELVTSHWIFQSRLVPCKLTNWLKSNNKIETSILLSSVLKRINRPPGISEKLEKILYNLAAKNRNLYQEFQTTSSRDKSKDSVTNTIFSLHEGLKRLQVEMMRIQGIRILKRSVVTRRKRIIRRRNFGLENTLANLQGNFIKESHRS